MMAKKKSTAAPAAALDTDALNTLLDDLKEVGPLAQRIVADLVGLFRGKAPMQAAKAVKCGPDGEDDPAACIHCVIHAQVAALAAAVQAQHALEDDGVMPPA
jgi:hypothetical protein